MTRWWQGKHPKNGAWLPQKLVTEHPQPHMFPGQSVKIVGLRSAFGVHLNGKEGMLKQYDGLLGRWLVHVDAEPLYARPWSLVPVVRRLRLIGHMLA